MPHARSPVAVVTDSTSYLPSDPAVTARVTVVPLLVMIGGQQGREGLDIVPADIERALGTRRLAVTTSRPAPADFAETYQRLLAAGAPGVVSVHLSAELSGTYSAAVLAAAEFGGRVEVIDSRLTGMGLGFAALDAARVAAEGADLDRVRVTALDAVARTSMFFYVDTLEFLRRGGRIGAASALVGTALSVKPILHVVDGSVTVRDRVRTTTRALARLVDLAVEQARDSDVDVAIHFLGTPQRAEQLRAELASRLGRQLRDCYLAEVGAVVAAHVGPGLVGVVVHRRVQ